MEPDAVEIRVLGCLIEKQHTTPDVYPLSLNSLRLACNQATNREPVVDYDEQTVVEALRRLALRGWTRLASTSGSRARKYRHLLKDAFGLDDAELSLLAVLMLRGPQTPGELKQRGQRLHDFADLGAVQDALNRLVERGQVARHERRPGQKEDRYEQLLGGASIEPTPVPQATASVGIDEQPSQSEGPAREKPAEELTPAEDRLTRLEREVAELRTELASLRADLGD
ncbi:MAG TPA: YceH family protein [Solirubrobacterales bacterium]